MQKMNESYILSNYNVKQKKKISMGLFNIRNISQITFTLALYFKSGDYNCVLSNRR